MHTEYEYYAKEISRVSPAVGMYANWVGISRIWGINSSTQVSTVDSLQFAVCSLQSLDSRDAELVEMTLVTTSFDYSIDTHYLSFDY